MPTSDGDDTAVTSPASDAGGGYIDWLRCFACDHRYGYVGADPQPGRCPECGSRAVPPSEPFTVTEVVDRRPTGDQPAIVVDGRDATGRLIRFRFRVIDSGVRLDTLAVGETLVAAGAWDGNLVPAAVERELGARDLSLTSRANE
jgi:hypothetical protein